MVPITCGSILGTVCVLLLYTAQLSSSRLVQMPSQVDWHEMDSMPYLIFWQNPCRKHSQHNG